MSARTIIEDESARDFILRQIAQGKMTVDRWRPARSDGVAYKFEAQVGTKHYRLAVWYDSRVGGLPSMDIVCYTTPECGAVYWRESLWLHFGDLAQVCAEAKKLADARIARYEYYA